jgi:hypothetical protein
MKAFMNTSLLSGLQYGSKVSSWPFSSVWGFFKAPANKLWTFLVDSYWHKEMI